MKNLDMFKSKIKETAQAIVAALKTDDEAKVNEAFESLVQDVHDSVKADFEAVQGATDSKILSDRGIRQLTSNEMKYWNAFISANKQKDVKQAIANISVAFPETIIEDIYKEMADAHPLLSVINFQNVATVTKWIMDDSSVDKAVWGEITEEVVKEIGGAIKLVEMTQGKLSAFALVPIDIIDMGPSFVDAFIRRLLGNSIYSGIEYGIIQGKGVKGEPIGLIRDIHKGVSFSSENGYPSKTAIKVSDLTPASYGALLAKLCVTEKGNYRTLTEVAFVCNPVDYFKKIMPSTTALLTDGTYKSNILPFPTKIVSSSQIEEGKAALFVPSEYFFGIGSAADGTIEYDDSFKFLEDKRAYKIKFFANGRAYDDTVALLLDVSELEPLYFFVKNVTAKADETQTPTDEKSQDTPQG